MPAFRLDIMCCQLQILPSSRARPPRLSSQANGPCTAVSSDLPDRPLPLQVMHVGDRFTASGNDSAVRDCCSILWVANPGETDFFIRMLLNDIQHCRHPQLPVWDERKAQACC